VVGLHSPDRFIAVVEETGLILEIGAWAIGVAAEFAATINRGRDVPLLFSINLSPGQFRDPNLLSRLDEIIARTGVDPAWLSIEVTESVFSGPPQEAAALCRRLRERGFGLAIDDFATACSSLRQLDAFPLTEMKVDVSFVRDVHSNRYRQTVIEAAVVICRELGVTVTAEGIESEEERQTLQQIGCLYGQGYLFSLPLAAPDFSWLLENHPTLPAQHAVRQASAA
jgi:EAL domain-containing protein (putative c-di-GMP-specific phosphodiesterase class I)